MMIIPIVGLIGCSGENNPIIAEFPRDHEVFLDDFGPTATFQAFSGSKLDAVQIDQVESYLGTKSLIVTVPDSNDASGSFAGGAFTAGVARDLSEYNVLTFWAKADRNVTLNVAGLGNDNTGTSKYTAERNDLAITTTWQKIIIPIPLAEKLVQEQGLFYFAEGPENGIGCQIWFDEIQFENLTTITNPRPVIETDTIDVESGGPINIGNGSVAFSVDGSDIVVSAMPAYFTYVSSNSSIVSVGADATFTASGVGSVTITASIGSVSANGAIAINVIPPQAVPTTPAPAPTEDPSNVVSLFSDTYTNVTVNLWSTDWDVTDLENITIGSDSVKKYYNLSFAGIEFTAPTVDASTMTRFHMDIWTPNTTESPTVFKIKLVDFGANGSFGGGDDVEHELTFDHNSLETESWVAVDVPLAAFSGLTTTGHLAQMIISGDLTTVYVDNIYFYDAGVQNAPTISAPTPTADAADVVSLYSDVYTSVTVDTWSAVFDNADVADYTIGSDSMKQYTNLVFAVIDFRSNTLDGSLMTHFHMDVWTPDATSSPSLFKIKLVDLGSNGVYGGGDDVEHEITLNHITMNTAVWVSIDIPLSDFTGLTTKGQIGQIIITSDPNTVYLDNIYLYDSGIPTIPPDPAPAPTLDSVNVISLFSDVYTNVPVDTWSAPWDSAGVTDYMIGSDNTKKYTTLLFAGIEFANPTIDASTMTHFHMDIWTPDPTNAPATFEIKLVDFGANGVYDGGDDVEHEIILDETTMNSNSWVSIELALSDFTNLTTRGHLAQLIITCDPNTVYVDNVYFHK